MLIFYISDRKTATLKTRIFYFEFRFVVLISCYIDLTENNFVLIQTFNTLKTVSSWSFLWTIWDFIIFLLVDNTGRRPTVSWAVFSKQNVPCLRSDIFLYWTIRLTVAPRKEANGFGRWLAATTRWRKKVQNAENISAHALNVFKSCVVQYWRKCPSKIVRRVEKQSLCTRKFLQTVSWQPQS